MLMREELLTLLQLKDIPRTVWIRAGGENPESVAAHSWGMAVLALRLCPDHLERAGMLKIAPQWIDFFDEYEQGLSEEAQFVKNMDKLDMGLQAMHYQHQGLDLSEFITSARSKTDSTEFASLLE